MTDTRGGSRSGGQARVSTDEIIKNARRRARAANSRRRSLLDDSAVPVTDGPLALQPVAEPVGETRLEPDPDGAVGRQRSTVGVERRTVTPPEPVTTARMPFVLSMLGLIAVGIVGLLVLNTAINENAFILQDLRQDQAQLDAGEQQLTDELADLSAPNNLAVAAARLGLVKAESITYIRLPDGKELKMPTPGDD